MEHPVLHMSVHCRAGMHESTRKRARFRRQLCSCERLTPDKQFMSRIFRSCIFDRPVFSCLAFSVAPFEYRPRVCVKSMLSLCDSLCKYAILSRLILYGQQIHTRSSSCYRRWRARRAMSVRILCYAANIYTYCY